MTTDSKPKVYINPKAPAVIRDLMREMWPGATDMALHYVQELLDGNGYWCSQHGKPEQAATMKRLHDEVGKLGGESFSELEKAFNLRSYGDRVATMFDGYFFTIHPKTSAVEYLDALATIYKIADMNHESDMARDELPF